MKRPAAGPNLRGAMQHFATGVCIATTYVDNIDGRRHDAVTVNSLMSISLQPPLVSLCLRRDSGFLLDVLRAKVWAVSILDAGGTVWARQLACRRAVRAAAVSVLPAAPGASTGALVLDASNWLECVLWATFDIGDHTMVVGEVVATGVQHHGPPLIFVHGRYTSCLERTDGQPNAFPE
jgi:flavin reductase (DIM6/NTAB) family NADH-FMN oxidoreductase RutF